MVRTENGKGDILPLYTPFQNRNASCKQNRFLDPEGIGVEMEANKPGWCDALNGLPAILGSSINETAAIKRLALIVKDAVEKAGLWIYKSLRGRIQILQYHKQSVIRYN